MSSNRRFSVRREFRGNSGTPTSVQRESAVQALAPSYWFRADTVTLTGSNVTALRNRVGADTLNITAGTMAAPAFEASLGWAPALSFAGTQYFDSSLAASAWKFLHDGTGCEIFHVFVPTTTNSSYMLCTSPGTATNQRGLVIYSAIGTSSRSFIGNGTTTVFDSGTVGAFVINAAAYIDFYYSESLTPKISIRKNATSIYVSTTPGTPSSNDPTGTFRLGAGTTGTATSYMKWSETLIFNRGLLTAERAGVQQYLSMRYGL